MQDCSTCEKTRSFQFDSFLSQISVTENTCGYSALWYVQGVPNWYLHFQMVITQKQKIVKHGIIHQKK